MNTIAYVANADSREISVLRLDTATGGVETLQQMPTEGDVMPLAVGPDRRVLHASIRSEPFAVQSFSIDPASGRLALLGRADLPASMCWISTDRSGCFLLSASYGSSLIAVSPVDASGVVGPAQQTAATEANAHAVQATPDNRFLLASSLGGGVVLRYGFDAASGRFDAPGGSANASGTPAWRARPGAGPRHFVFHPSRPFVYLINELDATIDVLAFDAATGGLNAVQRIDAMPAGIDGEPWAADIHLTPDGRFLYASERRSSTLVAFTVDATSGRLTANGTVPTEAQPRGFAIDPSGRWLLAVGQRSTRLAVYAIDDASGRLGRRGDHPVGRNPNWVEIVDLG